MDNLNFWKRLRVLTTNSCNYSCRFCHNEGQKKGETEKLFLKFNEFKIIIDSLIETPLKEIHFSGGEPFMNKETLDMILYSNENTSYEIGCATNTTFLTKNSIKELSKTRIKLNIQFPAFNSNDFKKITKNGNIYHVKEKIDLLKKYDVNFGFNYVLHGDDLNTIQTIINFIKQYDVSIKLLPDLNQINSQQYKDAIFPYLDRISNNKINKSTGAIKWEITNTGKSALSIMYVDSPCFYSNITDCKNYAEVRLLPDMRLQPCIKKNEFYYFDFKINNENRNLIMNRFQETWNSFIGC